MAELVPCGCCRRHVAINEAACPFCAAVVPPSRSQRFIPRGFSRAAVFAAALTGSACDQGAKPAKQPDKVGSAAGPSDAAVDALTPEELERIRRQEQEELQRHPAMPYGAPPARARFV